MALKSAADGYGAVAVSIHWVSVVLILILIGSGFRAAGAADPAAKAAILRLHIPIAIAVLALTAFRIVWWLGFDRKPGPVPGSPRWQERSAQVVHILFYIVILGVIASGAGMMALSGAAPLIFGGGAPSLPDFWKYPPRLPHAIGARLLLALLALHVGAALYHHFVRRDGLIWRMWFARPPLFGVDPHGEGEKAVTKIIHPVAGALAILTIATFWLSTALTELFASRASVIAVKTAIAWGFLLLIPALAAAGGLGFALTTGGGPDRSAAKIKRIQISIGRAPPNSALPPRGFLLGRLSNAGPRTRTTVPHETLV